MHRTMNMSRAPTRVTSLAGWVLALAVAVPAQGDDMEWNNEVLSSDTADLVLERVVPSDSNASSDTSASPVMGSVAWAERDTCVEVVVSFNRVPPRYLAYALTNSDRIVLDCFETGLRTTVPDEGLPAPVVSASLKSVTVDPGIELARLVIYTQRAVAFHVVETADALTLVLDRDVEEPRDDTALSTKQKRRRIVFISLGAAAIAGVSGTLGYVLSRPDGGDDGEEKIPFINVPTPDGN